MSRVIKFRAWDEAEKWMGEVSSIDFEEGYLFLTTRNSDDENRFDLRAIPLMQFTGLYDKNGAEIYEGDILRVWQEDEYIPNRDRGGGIIDYDKEKGFSQIGKVGFTGCSFDYRTVKTLSGKEEKIHAPIDWINNYEVIGNIYEHPHLLEVAQ
ncbi:YopX family protein [Sporosarcina sp. USHLN248]|uniref:YopX family protein n=1 Tax=Sporosarcina sp. USHLN248 TaxID=3081300 RepID=UPI0030199951